jgi:hypothetical protein
MKGVILNSIENPEHWVPFLIAPQTSFVTFLHMTYDSVPRIPLNSRLEWTSKRLQDLVHILEVIKDFISHGANLEEVVYLALDQNFKLEIFDNLTFDWMISMEQDVEEDRDFFLVVTRWQTWALLSMILHQLLSEACRLTEGEALWHSLVERCRGFDHTRAVEVVGLVGRYWEGRPAGPKRCLHEPERTRLLLEPDPATGDVLAQLIARDNFKFVKTEGNDD